MKSFRVLLPLLAQFLGQVAASQAGPSLLDACDDLSIDHSDGVLSGKCHGTGDAVQTSVDLDQCLGWGPRAAHLGLRGYTAGLAPEKDGAFTDYCGPCYIIDRGELNQEAAHLLCNCGPDDSDISTEYSFDLAWSPSPTRAASNVWAPLVTVSAMLPLGPVVMLPLNRTWAENRLTGLGLRGREYHAKTASWTQTPARRNRYQTYFEAFTLIEGRGHIWRLHFTINRFTLDLTTQLSNVVQFCNPQDMENCEGETPLDTPPKLPDDDNGVNFMERFEECVYDDGESEHERKNRLCEVGLEPGTSSSQ
ncbi:hypothetical protein LA080_004476 [Diaporthe eres]|nr:hypothetical protein LA080_004476 [Diaporthe eres]